MTKAPTPWMSWLPQMLRQSNRPSAIWNRKRAYKNQTRYTPRPILLGLSPIALVLLALTRPPAAFAGGFFLYELGTPDVGLASAGYELVSAKVVPPNWSFTWLHTKESPAGNTL